MIAIGLVTLEGLDPELENVGKQMCVLADAGKQKIVTTGDLEEWALPPRIVDLKGRLEKIERAKKKRTCRQVVM